MNWSEDQLIEKCLAGDRFAQKHFFEFHSKRMMGVCLRYSSSTDEAQDVLQVGFVKVFEKLNTFKQKGSLEGWIKKIIVNTALDNIRKNKRNNEHIEIEKIDFQLNNNEENGFDALNAKDLLTIIQKLPIGFRTVFNMYAIEGYSHKEIAEELNISINTSKSQYSRAKQHLQHLLLKENIIKIEKHT